MKRSSGKPLLALTLGGVLVGAAGPRTPAAPPVTLSRNEPVTFTADSLSYDRESGIVTAQGHVEAWQGTNVLRADKVTYDRNTNVVAASGHVVLLQTNGDVLFSDYAELSQGMREGVLKGMRALLAGNGRLAANGARRVEGKVNELSRGVYSTCNLCKKDPTKPPFWQLRALSITQDVEHKKIEYKDAVMEIYGIPVLYTPYFSHADPSVKRESGFLVPSVGASKFLGAFAEVPYYWVLDKESDLTLTGLLPTQTGPELGAIYRRRFNNGTLRINAAAAYNFSSTEESQPGFSSERPGFQGYVFAKGDFTYNDEWRYGFNINDATSPEYLRDYRVTGVGTNVLTNSLYAEGFGQGSYAKLDALSYQGVNGTVSNSELPYVLPHYEYEYTGQPDMFGGRLSVATNDFNVWRQIGADDQRGTLSLNWERPAVGQFGDVWKFTLHGDAVAYNAFDLNEQPDFAPVRSVTTARALPQAAAEVRLPLQRDGGSLGSQLIEPIVQFIVAPNTGSSGYRDFPNEDSFTPEFTDADLFSLNRFPGLDRLEGGVRANVGLHGSWTIGSTTLDGLVGQNYRFHSDDTFMPGLGIGGTTSDIVARASIIGDGYDLTYRTRIDHRNGDTRFAEAVGSFGPPSLRLNVGYIFSAANFYYEFQNPGGIFFPGTPKFQLGTTPRNELSLAISTREGPYRLSGYARRDIQNGEMVAVGADAAYENECFILDVNFYRRYTSILGDNGDSAVLVSLTFKTVGTFGFHAF